MNNSEDIKNMVRSKYNQIALQNKEYKDTCGCGEGDCCESIDYTIFREDYSKLNGYTEEADLGLGCGVPTAFANIKPGDVVIDLGSGAGNDAFVARAIVGEEGEVIGLDFAGAMITKAKKNARDLNFNNVYFVRGDIEEMPFKDNTADVIISNCVLNLVPDKKKAFDEIRRVLKANGHFCVSDMVITGNLPDEIRNDMAMYAGCVAGALQKDDYLNIIDESGFEAVEVKKFREIEIPDEIMLKYLSNEDLENFRKSKTGIYSMTVTAKKNKYHQCTCFFRLPS